MFVDLHTTDSAKFQHDISINIAPLAPRKDELEATAAELAEYTVRRLTELGHLPVAFDPAFRTNDDPTSGFAIYESPPRFSHNYAGARSRLAMLVETHSWRTYRERAESTYRTLQAIFEAAKQHAAGWAAAEAEADSADAQLGGTDVTLVWDTGSHKTEIEFRGYAYTKTILKISGVHLLALFRLACRASFAPGDASLRAATAQACEAFDGDPLWPALARHVARISTTADRTLLEDLARHPEQREPPLSWGLQCYVRGDLVLDDDSVVELDDLCAQLGLAPLPVLEAMPDELEIPLDEPWMNPPRNPEDASVRPGAERGTGILLTR